jgi:glycosyltransferase involved in cell wall biosynthesis
MLIPQLSFGGAERVFHDQSREFAEAGHEVTECVFQTRTRQIAFPTTNRLIVLDAPDATGSLASKATALNRRVAQVRKIKQDLKIDVCISHLEGADYINILSKGSEQVILCIHNSKQNDPNYSSGLGWVRRRMLMPLLYRRADRLVTVSRDLRQEMIDYLHLDPAKITVINNFIDSEQVLQKAAEPIADAAEAALFAGGPVLMGVARLDPEKNSPVLIPILDRLRQQGPAQPRLLLLGDGSLREQIVAEARRRGLPVWDGVGQTYDAALPDCAVVLLGFRANPFQYMKHAAAVVLPSLMEGFPMNLCEALTCGIPMASADCATGPREILAPTTPAKQYAAGPEWADFGLLLPVPRPNTPSYEASLTAWVEGLGELLNNPARDQHYRQRALVRAADFGAKPAMVRWEILLQDKAAVL